MLMNCPPYLRVLRECKALVGTAWTICSGNNREIRRGGLYATYRTQLRAHGCATRPKHTYHSGRHFNPFTTGNPFFLHYYLDLVQGGGLGL